MAVLNWSCDDVKTWLESEGFGGHTTLLCDQHGVDGEVLLTLTEKDLRSPPLQLKKLSDIKKLDKSIKRIQLQHSLKRERFTKGNGKTYFKFDVLQCNRHANMTGLESSDMQTSDEEGVYTQKEKYKKNVFLPEYKKLLVSFAYAFVVSWITAYMMVIVHERVPDKQKYPPLPDIFLDNVPLIPYAFQLAEVCGISLASIFIGILIFHKHRVIVLRRFFSIASTVFLLRSVTMFVTSLSVPGEHLECEAINYSSWQKVTRATQIVTGFGMSLTGLHTCGDYMFSGHTAYLTLFNHLITEYTPRKMHLLHTTSWVLNLFGVFFILAAHEHYSIDVFIALYITSRIFLYYHMLTNTRSYSHSKRIKVWFPLLSYFECNVPGKVPNAFEWPISFEIIYEFRSKLQKQKKGH